MRSFLPTRALGRLPVFVAALGLLGLTACQPDSTSMTSPAGEEASEGPETGAPDPAFARSDGASGGNPAVWFLPPLVPNPQGDPEFEPDKFNPDLDVDIRIFECGASDDDCPATLGDATGPELGGPASVPNDHYQFDWKTPRNGNGKVYRAFVEAEGLVVGFLDIELRRGGPRGRRGGPGAAGSDPDDNAFRNPGSTAPIKVMIEEAVTVGCESGDPQCIGIVGSEPTEDVLLELEEDGDQDNDLTLHIPAGTSFEDGEGNPVESATFTLQACQPGTEFDVDLRLVGPCFTIVSDPPNIELADGEAIVGICDLESLNEPFASQDQRSRVTIHQFDNGSFAEVLPHAHPEGCPVVGSSLPAHPLLRLAAAATDRVVDWLTPGTLIAGSALLDTGGGGRLGSFRSNFSGAIPSRIEVGPGGDLGPVDAPVGDPVDPAPIVRVVDSGGEPVEGATVRFDVLGPAGSSTVDGQSSVEVLTDDQGLADGSWVLNDAENNPHELRVWAKGMVVGANADVLMPVNWPGDPQNPQSLSCDDTDPGDPVADGCFDEWLVAGGFTFQANGVEGCDGTEGNECSQAVESNSTSGSLLVLETEDPDGNNDLTLEIPSGTTFEDENGDEVQNVTFTLGTCDAPFDADLKLVSDCFQILTDPPNITLVGNQATVSICELEEVADNATDATFASHAQEERVSIYQYDNGVFAEALPHEAPVGCGGSALGPQNALGRLASAALDGVLEWLRPEPLIARSSMLDTGGGGRLGSFRSFFQAALPSMIVVPSDFPTDGDGTPVTSAELGGQADPPPTVEVVDAGGEPVEGATVRFEVVNAAGSTIVGPTTAVTGADGSASVDWQLETLDNPHELRVFAKGMTRSLDRGGSGIIQPGTTDPEPIGGSDFCSTNECAAGWIVAEELVYEGYALFEADFESTTERNAWTTSTPAGSPLPGLWNRSELDLSNTAEPDPWDYVDLATGDGSAGALPAPFEGSWAFWYGDHVGTVAADGAPELGNYLGSAVPDCDASGPPCQTDKSGGISTGAHTGELLSPTFTMPPALPTGHVLQLQFASWFEIESVDPHAFDLMDVTVEEVGGGGASVTVTVNPTSDPNGPPAAPFTSGGFDAPPAWTAESVVLAGLEGKTVRIRARFRSGDTNFNGFRGWVVDDFRVVKAVLSPSIQASVVGGAALQTGETGPRPIGTREVGGN